MPEFTFDAGSGPVRAILQRPADSDAILLLGHGAGADMRHRHMQSIADALAAQNVATCRFNFPFSEAGRRRVDSARVCTTTIARALRAVTVHAGDLPVFLGGHSFGGRMASHFAADSMDEPAPVALIYFSFPLHPASKPGIGRAEHMDSISLPQLFLSGTRDALADMDLLSAVVARLHSARLHKLDTADHSFKILKRTRTSTEDVYTEAARIAGDFVRLHIRQQQD